MTPTTFTNMAIYAHDGTAYRDAQWVFSYSGNTRRQPYKVYKHDGTSYRLVKTYGSLSSAALTGWATPDNRPVDIGGTLYMYQGGTNTLYSLVGTVWTSTGVTNSRAGYLLNISGSLYTVDYPIGAVSVNSWSGAAWVSYGTFTIGMTVPRPTALISGTWYGVTAGSVYSMTIAAGAGACSSTLLSSTPAITAVATDGTTLYGASGASVYSWSGSAWTSIGATTAGEGVVTLFSVGASVYGTTSTRLVKLVGSSLYSVEAAITNPVLFSSSIAGVANPSLVTFTPA